MNPPLAAPPPPAWARCIGQLPSLPGAFLAAVEVLGRDDAPASACIEAIERDQALTVRVLRLANSAFYGAPGQVSRIGDAVQMLGLRTVASTLAAVSLRTSLAGLRCPGFDFEGYWRHSLCTAIAARELAGPGALDAGQAFLAGLLHDVGQLILAMTHPEQEAQALRLCRSSGVCLHAAEQAVLGVSHAEVGAAVAIQWKFPAPIAEAIAGHHRTGGPAPGERLTLSGLVQQANPLAHRLAATEPDTAALLAEPLWALLGMGERRAGMLIERIRGELAVMVSV